MSDCIRSADIITIPAHDIYHQISSALLLGCLKELFQKNVFYDIL